ncbi:dynein light chain Tctex-type 5-like [Euwallacea similis]|uniref:dynein light chain Tctex-type 5-like n=1 Tax=Euwallacea similis TaxID=1736056 RepID=UPI00345107F7
MSTNSLFGNSISHNNNDEGPRYQNTYKLDSDNPFNTEKVGKILQEVMNEIIENLQYDPEKCAAAAKHASVQIRGKVKQLEFDRYKLVCIVSIGEKNSQDIYATCRFLWDPEKDRHSVYSLENTYVYAIAYCFGLYYD